MHDLQSHPFAQVADIGALPGSGRPMQTKRNPLRPAPGQTVGKHYWIDIRAHQGGIEHGRDLLRMGFARQQPRQAAHSAADRNDIASVNESGGGGDSGCHTWRHVVLPG